MNAYTELAREFAKYLYDPLGFVQFAWPWGERGTVLEGKTGPCSCQRKVLKRVGEEARKRRFDGRTPVAPLRVNIVSGHGIGKTTLVPMLVFWILATRPFSRGTLTANTNTQLDTKTWAAVQAFLKVSPILSAMFKAPSERCFELGNKAEWFVNPQTCKEENSQAFAGQHSANATSCYFNDEASEIADKIYEVEQGGMMLGEPMQFSFGNPTRNYGHFYESTFGSLKDEYITFSIDSRECELTNKEELNRLVAKYGEDSDFIRVRVRGLPPKSGLDQFIDLHRIQGAQERRVVAVPEDPLVVGADFAWGGSDMNVFRFREGLDARSIEPVRIPGDQTRDYMVLVSRIAGMLSQTWGPRNKKIKRMFCDTSGIAAPVAAALRQRGFDQVVGINFAGHSPDPQYANMRAYMYGRLREWLNTGTIPRDAGYDALEQDLLAQQLVRDTRNGKLQLVDKADIRAMLGRSPDDSDSLALTHAEDVPMDLPEYGGRRIHVPSGAQAWMM